MEKEKEYRAVLPVDKKHYAYADIDGVVKTKGLSSTRKDRFGICRDMTSLVATTLLLDEDIDRARKYICLAIDKCYAATIQGTLDMYSVSKEVRYEGNTCYRWTDIDEQEINLPVSRANANSRITYSADKILDALERDINKLCIPAGVGTVRNILLDFIF